jgi:methionyl-tRNA synthetase
MEGKVPDYSKYADPEKVVEKHKEEVNEQLKVYNESLEGCKLRAGLQTALRISSQGNKLLQDNKLSNQLIEEDPERCAAVVGLALNHIHLLASLISPFMPATAEAILQQLNVPVKFQIPDTWTADAIAPGHTLGEPKLLFTQIPASRIDEWREAFGGEEIRKQKALEAEKAAAKKAAKEKEKEKKRLKKEAALAAAASGQTADAAAPTSTPDKAAVAALDAAPDVSADDTKAAEVRLAHR